MFYDLLQTRRGRDTIVMTGELPKVRDHMKKLRNSQRKGIKGDKIIYRILLTENTEKFKQKSHSEDYRSGGSEQFPKRVNRN